jgi:hypothetical protein
MALGMNKLKMDLLGQTEDGTSSGWIHRDRLRWNELEMDSLRQTKDGTSSGWIRQDGLPTRAPHVHAHKVWARGRLSSTWKGCSCG